MYRKVNCPKSHFALQFLSVKKIINKPLLDNKFEKEITETAVPMKNARNNAATLLFIFFTYLITNWYKNNCWLIHQCIWYMRVTCSCRRYRNRMKVSEFIPRNERLRIASSVASVHTIKYNKFCQKNALSISSVDWPQSTPYVQYIVSIVVHFYTFIISSFQTLVDHTTTTAYVAHMTIALSQ